MPVDYGSLAASSGAASRPVTIDFSGCQATTKFAVQFDFDANGGSYSHFTKLSDQAP